jgi:hypothetical protein
VIDLGTWEFTDGNGDKVRVEVRLDDSEKKMWPAVRKLANRARHSPRKKAAAMAGAFQVTVLSDTQAR